MRLATLVVCLLTLALVPNVAAQTLPAGWTAANVGSPSLSGTASYQNGVFTVSGAGSDIWGSSDQFMFAYRQITGDGVLTARVTSLQNTDGGAKAGVMIRESLSGGARNAFAMLLGNMYAAYSRRGTAGGATGGNYSQAVSAPIWLRLERRGNRFTYSGSMTGTSWMTITTQSVTMASTVYVGLAVTSHRATARATAAFSNVTVTGASTPTPPANQAPSVSLTSPSTNVSYPAPASVSMAATASDSDGSVARVDFYNGTTLLWSDTTAPYAYTWSSVAAGSYSVTAVARDNAGASTTSTARTVAVTTSSNPAPSVSLTSPAAGSSFLAPASITLSATASDADGIARVDFYAGSTLIGSDTTSPYAMTWSNVAIGAYALVAMARDNRGAVTSSATRDITVTSTAIPDRAIFTASSNDATAVDRYVLEVYPNGATPGVSNPVATQDLGKPPLVNGEYEANVTATIGGLPTGTYIATVTAIGAGGSSRSAPSPPFTR